MPESFLIGASVGLFVSVCYKISHQSYDFRWEAFVLIVFIIISFFIPAKAEAWCDKCKPIPNHLLNGALEIYRHQGEESERLILEIKALTDEYSFNGSDAFMASIGAGMTALPEAGDPRAVAVAVILANTATYFCKTVQCHWKTAFKLNELEFHLYYLKQTSEELLHNRFMCLDCHHIFFQTHYMGNRKFYINHYPPCSFEEDGCNAEEFDLGLQVRTKRPKNRHIVQLVERNSDTVEVPGSNPGVPITRNG